VASRLAAAAIVARAATEAGARTSNAAAWLAGRLATAPPPSPTAIVGGGDPTFLIFLILDIGPTIFIILKY
jgi:hypothetical protein